MERLTLFLGDAGEFDLVREALAEQGLSARACADVEALDHALSQGAGAVVVGAEVLANGGVSQVADALAAHGPCGYMPLLVLADAGDGQDDLWSVLGEQEALCCASLVQRPLVPSEVANAVKTALRFYETQMKLCQRLRESEAQAVDLRESGERERARAAELETIMETVPAAVWIARDPECREIVANHAAYELLRLPPAGKLSLSADGASGDARYRIVRNGRPVPPEDLPAQVAARTGKAVDDFEADVVFDDGTVRHQFGRAVPLWSADGRARGSVGVFMDITDRLYANRERDYLLAENRRQREFLEKLVENAPIGIAVVEGPQLRYRLANPSYRSIPGVGDMDMVGRTMAEVFPDASASALEPVKEVMRTGRPVTLREFSVTPNQQRGLGWWNVECVPLGDPSDQVEAVLILAHEVTDQVVARWEIEQYAARAEMSLNQLEAVINSIDEALVVAGPDGQVIDMNPAGLTMHGYADLAEARQHLSQYGADFELYDLDGRLLAPEEWPMARALAGETFSNEELWVRRQESGLTWIGSYSGTPVRDGRERVTLGVVTIRDVTEAKRFEEELEFNAFHDQLTQLPNRALFLDRLQHAMVRAERHHEIYAVLIVDLDNFKVVNDSLGHLSGDQLLAKFAMRIQQCLRPVDTLARFGGDEFTILLEDIEDIDATTAVAERIREVLRDPFYLDNHELHTSVSIGVALGSVGYSRAEDALRDADTALYRAKHAGKGCHVVFDHSMREAAVSRLQLEIELRRTVTDKKLDVFYQPVVDVQEGGIAGCEALARWYHPVFGRVDPKVFVPVAEESGIIVPLGGLVLERACRELAKWRESGIVGPDFYVSVNLSATQFTQSDLVSSVDGLMSTYGLQGRNLRLEITETTLIRYDSQAARVLVQLRERGIAVCMDDFGTGYSSLGYLHRFPIDVLKIDQFFVQRLDGSDDSRAVVRTIASLADNLGLEVVAEGAESEEQLLALRQLGLRWVQGFIFQDPVNRNKMEQLLSLEETGAMH